MLLIYINIFDVFDEKTNTYFRIVFLKSKLKRRKHLIITLLTQKKTLILLSLLLVVHIYLMISDIQFLIFLIIYFLQIFTLDILIFAGKTKKLMMVLVFTALVVSAMFKLNGFNLYMICCYLILVKYFAILITNCVPFFKLRYSESNSKLFFKNSASYIFLVFILFVSFIFKDIQFEYVFVNVVIVVLIMLESKIENASKIFKRILKNRLNILRMKNQNKIIATMTFFRIEQFQQELFFQVTLFIIFFFLSLLKNNVLSLGLSVLSSVLYTIYFVDVVFGKYILEDSDVYKNRVANVILNTVIMFLLFNFLIFSVIFDNAVPIMLQNAKYSADTNVLFLAQKGVTMRILMNGLLFLTVLLYLFIIKRRLELKTND